MLDLAVGLAALQAIKVLLAKPGAIIAQLAKPEAITTQLAIRKPLNLAVVEVEF